MFRSILRTAASGALLGTLLSFSTSQAEDWPQWRGANRDGVWREEGVLEKFPAKEMPVKWRVEIGAGYSGPTIADGRVFVTDRLTKPVEQERILCFDEATGQPLWVKAYDCPYGKIGYQAGPRASVTVEGKVAYALGATGRAFALDVASGDVIWEKDCEQLYEIDMPIWGIAGAPLLYENLIILHIGGKGACVVALDKRTGEEVWKALGDRAQYSSPILVKQGETDVVIVWTGDSASGINAKTGNVVWNFPWKPRNMPIGIATPIVENNMVFFTSFYDGSLMLKLDPAKPTAEKVWQIAGRDERNTEALHSIISTPLMRGGYIYGCDSYGELRCLDAATGERIWEDLTATPKARWSNIHFVQRGAETWMFNERGELIIGKLAKEGFTEISRTKILEPTTEQLRQRGGVCWSHPAFANRHVFVRNDKELVCVSLEKK